ncbi:MAG: hypothetical protein ACXWIP_29575 [Burkholderiales bacterium]
MATLRLPSEGIELFPPASTEQLSWLMQQYPGFLHSEYLALLGHTDGIGEVFEDGSQRFVHNMLLFSASEALEVSENEFGCAALAVGRTGVDGIVFVLQPSSPRIFAYLPIDEEFRPVASSLQDFLDKWSTGELRLQREL